MSILFEPIKIKNLILPNRFIMSAAADNLDNDRDAQLQRFRKLAEGNIGLIICGGTRPNAVEKWQPVIDAVHKKGGKFAVQLVSIPGPGVSPWSDPNADTIAVSVLDKDSVFFNNLIKYGKHHAATEDEIIEIIKNYGKAAAKIKEIGADAIQIHAAHQNLLSQFLSPITNKRTDRWGVSLENRTRIHCEIYKTVRKAVGDDFPILIKLGVADAFPDGLKFIEGKIAAQIIAQAGYDVLEISQGLQDVNDLAHGTPMRAGIMSIEKEGYFRNWCKEIKQLINKPTIMTGGLRSFELMEKLVQDGETDMIGMCRPFIREMNLIKRWQSGDLRKATCVSCNKCLTELMWHGKPLACYLDLAGPAPGCQA
jgi:2,4-dienoyl-CoA reductase-like NADH-dependent reductase (Old Yellow Enzyme family)